MSSPHQLTSSDAFEDTIGLARRIRRREISAVECAQLALSRIEDRNPEIQAFVQLDPKRALKAAERIDRRIAAGGPLPILAGVPSGIKDHEHMRGMKTRAGSRALAWVRAPFDGLLARRCREGGMVLLGKLSTSELTILPFVHTDLHPPTRNPVDPRHYSGGSSGGSAAAVAAGMLPIAPGSDGAGSIRVPAAFCGLVGVKPGRGVLFHEHAIVDPVEMSAVGPLARTVEDAAVLLDVLAGRAYDLERPPPESFLAASKERPRGLRIKLGVRSPLTVVDPEIEAAVRGAAARLERMGHQLEDGAPLEGTVEEFLPIMARMVRSVPLPPFTSGLLQPTTRWMRAQGRGRSRAEVVRATASLEARVIAWFGDADVWVLPSTPTPAPAVGRFEGLDGEAVFRAVIPIGAFTAGFNISGQPAISLPAGRTRSGLPIGVQLVGRRGRDAQLVALAAALEAALRA